MPFTLWRSRPRPGREERSGPAGRCPFPAGMIRGRLESAAREGPHLPEPGWEQPRRGHRSLAARASWRGRSREMAHRPPIAAASRWNCPAASRADPRSPGPRRGGMKAMRVPQPRCPPALRSSRVQRQRRPHVARLRTPTRVSAFSRPGVTAFDARRRSGCGKETPHPGSRHRLSPRRPGRFGQRLGRSKPRQLLARNERILVDD